MLHILQTKVYFATDEKHVLHAHHHDVLHEQLHRYDLLLHVHLLMLHYDFLNEYLQFCVFLKNDFNLYAIVMNALLLKQIRERLQHHGHLHDQS